MLTFFPFLKRFPKADPDEPNWRRPVLAMMAVTFLFTLMPFVFLGYYSRYQADDYCFSSSLIQFGYFGGVADWYTLNSNRFSAMLTIGLIDPLRVIGMQILPTLLILGMLGASILLINQFRKWWNWNIGVVETYILAGMVTFFTIYAAPDRFQSFYWRSGSVTYTLPVLLLILVLAWMVSLDGRKVSGTRLGLACAGIFLITFFNGGFSETTAAFQVTIFSLILMLVLWRSPVHSKIRRLLILASAVFGVLVAMVIMILSPANAFRLSTMPQPPPGILELIYLSFRFGLGFVVNTLQEVPLPVIMSLLLAFFLARLVHWKGAVGTRFGWIFWIIPLAAFLVIAAVCAPSAYGESAYPEMRALLPARWILTAAGITWFYLLGLVYQRWRSKKPGYQSRKSLNMVAFILIMLCFYPMRAIMVTLYEVPPYKARADAWDERTQDIERQKMAGKRDVVVQAYDSFGRIRELSDNPKIWVNRCAATFYGVDHISAK